MGKLEAAGKVFASAQAMGAGVVTALPEAGGEVFWMMDDIGAWNAEVELIPSDNAARSSDIFLPGGASVLFAGSGRL